MQDRRYQRRQRWRALIYSGHAPGLPEEPIRRNGPMQMTDIVNNKPQHRYELTVDGHIAASHYEIAGGVITFVHTEVPPELAGKGIGSKLLKGALDQVRADGLKVIAQCPFVKAYIEKHPDDADLLK
jgi:predicted GNAT family acetyltransferase